LVGVKRLEKRKGFMAEHEGPKTLPQSGEPGTFAVDAGALKRTPHVTYHPDQSGAPPKLRVQDLSVTYIDRKGNRTEAVRDVSFDVYNKPDAGEIIVFLGPSGCGKSTILKAVAGLLPPTEGEVLVDGKLVTDVGRDRGMVFQAYTSFGWLTVRQNVEYGLRLRGVAKSERRKVSDKILQSVGLADFAERYPKDLSGGMKQRVAIARTLVNNPRVVLMDEPFGALDPQTRWGMQSLLLDISRAENNAILFVTHDVSEAVYLADTIYVLSARPARILHQVDVPAFPVRDIALKSAPEFRSVEKKLLDLIYAKS
jgi:ABC-type nitrate/sulfonate/bicarbonate transport system ATPase subunit